MSGKTDNSIQLRAAEILLENNLEWHKWRKETPFISLPQGWKFKPIAPFGLAVARFLIERDDGQKFSVYLDCYENLGYFGGPHWEVYPIDDGNNERFSIEDTEGLINAVKNSKEGFTSL